MRQAQQNRRGRGRSRKGQNPLTRTYESNGPDVKIRGTPSHIAEKYVSMARDALSSGDPVLAENYLQHAEHYNRIIMAQREQQMSDGGRAANGAGRGRGGLHAPDDEGGDEGEPASGERQQSRAHDSQPNVPASGASADDGRQQRRGRHRGDDGERGDGEAGGGRANGRGPRRARYAENDDQPDFLKRPVRRRANDEADETLDAEVFVEADQAAE